MRKFFNDLGEIIGEGILTLALLLVHLGIGCVVIAIPFVAHKWVHYVYGDQPPIFVGGVNFATIVHFFDHVVALAILAVGGWRAVRRLWG